MFTVGTVDSQAGQQVTDSTSHAHKPPAARRVRLADKDARCFSANARTRSMWGYASAILRPPVDWQDDPAGAPHLGHRTNLKLGLIQARTRGARAREPGGEIRFRLALLFSLRVRGIVGDFSHRAMVINEGNRPQKKSRVSALGLTTVAKEAEKTLQERRELTAGAEAQPIFSKA